MAETVIKNMRLSDMLQRRMRDTKSFFTMDENSGPNDIEQHKIKNARKRTGISRRGNPSMYSVISDCDYQRFNNIKENRLPSPYRDYDNTLNPQSHFYTPGYSKTRHVASTGNEIDSEIEHIPPIDIALDKKNCPDGFEQVHERRYSSLQQKTLDPCRTHLREKELKQILCELTPTVDRSKITFLSNAFPEFKAKNNITASQHELDTIKYQYTSVTQSAFEDIPFDNYLDPRRWNLDGALQTSADPMRDAKSKNKSYPSVNEWRNGVDIYKYESTQLRPSNRIQLPHDFCSIYPRIQQIPSYSGNTGAYNKYDIDNPYCKDYKPFTILRNDVPKFGNCSDKPVFVGYTGKCKLLPGNRQDPFNSDPTIRNVFGQAC